MKILNLYKYILLVICGLQSVTLAAQGLDDDRAINNVLTMRVKMLDEFFQRFNGKYTVHAFQQEKLDSVLLEKLAKVMKDREKMIQLLVNQRNEKLVESPVVKEFVKQVVKDSTLLSFYDPDWYAVLTCKIKIKGKEERVNLTLKVQQGEQGDSRWVIVGCSPFNEKAFTPKVDSLFFIGPANNELNFMELSSNMVADTSLVTYWAKGIQPDYLTLFSWLTYSGTAELQKIESIKYYCLQVKNYMFTIEFFNRAEYNSGWLISSVQKMNSEQKVAFRKESLFVKGEVLQWKLFQR